MIISLLVTVVTEIIQAGFSWINLPQMPIEAITSIDAYLDLVFDNLGFLGFFVRVSTFKIVAISAIVLYTFSKLYRITIWLLHKLPIGLN